MGPENLVVAVVVGTLTFPVATEDEYLEALTFAHDAGIRPRVVREEDER